MAQAFLESLPRLQAAAVPADRGTQCHICTEDFDDKHKVPVKLPCGHIFDHDCLTQWFANNKKRTCPYCRQHYDIPYTQTYFESVMEIAVDALTEYVAEIDNRLREIDERFGGVTVNETWALHLQFQNQQREVFREVRLSFPTGDRAAEYALRQIAEEMEEIHKMSREGYLKPCL